MRETLPIFCVVILLTFAGVDGKAQQPEVRAGFLQDSIKLGEPIDYYLVARYPSHVTILFPDSTYRFLPFELQRKRYFPTRTTANQSVDSAVYRLTTFEIDSIQYLALPVFVAAARDCTVYFSARDSVVLKSMVQHPIPDTLSVQNLPLKTNTLYQRVAFLFNYPVLVVGSIVLVVLLVVVWLIFGKRIKRYFRVKKLQSNYASFTSAFADYINQLKTQFTPETTERALASWKKYLEQLEQKPYTKLTTRETIRLEKDESLGSQLRLLDQAIYGHNTSVTTPLEQLMHVAQQRYQKKLEEVKRER